MHSQFSLDFLESFYILPIRAFNFALSILNMFDFRDIKKSVLFLNRLHFQVQVFYLLALFVQILKSRYTNSTSLPVTLSHPWGFGLNFLINKRSTHCTFQIERIYGRSIWDLACIFLKKIILNCLNSWSRNLWNWLDF